MYKLIISTFLLSIVISCKTTNKDQLRETWKAEIAQTEKKFEKMAAEKGLAVAFSFYVADSGVVENRGKLYKGKKEIKEFYQSWTLKDVSLKWTPDFVEVSSSGDLGYTFGKYTFTFRDSTGNLKESTGIFHTVWKKQMDGNWRFVWD